MRGWIVGWMVGFDELIAEYGERGIGRFWVRLVAISFVQEGLEKVRMCRGFEMR